MNGGIFSRRRSAACFGAFGHLRSRAVRFIRVPRDNLTRASMTTTPVHRDERA
jgi:hypothetical protein